MAEAWFEWMRSTALQSSILILSLALIDVIIRRRVWPQLRLLAWMLVLLKLLLPPDLSSPISLRNQWSRLWERSYQSELFSANAFEATTETRGNDRLQSAPALAVQDQRQTKTDSNEAKRRPMPAISPVRSSQEPASTAVALSWPQALFLVWIVGLILLAFFISLRFRRVRSNLLGAAREASPEVREQLKQVSRLAGLSRPPRVVVSPTASSPAVFGALHPIVVLSDSEPSEEADLRNILLHEVVHIRRKDLLLQRLIVALQLVYWFNPLLILVRRKIEQLQELCCDAATARLLGQEDAGYRKTLLRASAKWLSADARPHFGQFALLENRSRILERMSWLERGWWRRRTLRLTAGGLLAILFLLVVIPMAAPAEDARLESFTLITARTTTPVGAGKTYLSAFEVLFVREDGTCRHFSGSSKDGRIQLSYPGRIEAKPGRQRSEEDLRADRDFLGESKVERRRVLVLARHYDPYFYEEDYFDPGLGCRLIRSLMITSSGVEETKPLALLEGVAVASAFRPNPVSVPSFMSDPKKKQQVREAYSEVADLIARYGKDLANLPDSQELYRSRNEQAKELASGNAIVANSLQPVDYPFWSTAPAQIGPDGSIYFSGRGTSEVHQCDPAGKIIKNYFVGNKHDFYDARSFVVDASGRLHALLGNSISEPPILFSLDRMRRIQWRIRRFDSAEVYTDVVLDDPLWWPSAFQLDAQGNYYLMDGSLSPKSPSPLAVSRYSPEGKLLVKFQIDPAFLPSDMTGIHSEPTSNLRERLPADWHMVVRPNGLILLLLNYWQKSEEPSPRVGRLFQLDLGSKTFSDITPDSPEPLTQLTGLYQYQDRTVLEWSWISDFQVVVPGEFRGLSYLHAKRYLTLWGESSGRPLLNFRGELVAYSPEFVVLRRTTPGEGPIYYRIPIA